MRILGNGSQRSTTWSAVYDMRDGSIQVVMGREYGQISGLAIGMTHR